MTQTSTLPAPADPRALSLSAPPWKDPRAQGMAVLIALCALSAFAPVVGNGFIDQLDDQRNFLGNLDFRGFGLPQITWAWSTTLLGVYQPLSWMLLELQYTAFGLDPAGYHAVSLVLHAVASVVLYLLILELVARGFSDPQVPRKTRFYVFSGLATLLFAVHPLRTEVVAWVSCQPYLPSLILGMLSVLVYLQATDHPGLWNRRHSLSLLLLAAALLSKAIAVPIPAVLVVLDIFPLRRIGPHRASREPVSLVLLQKLPYLALSVIFAAVAVWARRSVPPLEDGADLGGRLAQAAFGLGFYIERSLIPHGLSAFHLLSALFDDDDPSRLIRSLIALAVILAASAWFARRWPAIPAALAAYFLLIAPNLGLLRFNEWLVSERYAYASTIPLAALLAGGLVRLSLSVKPVWSHASAALTAIAAVGLMVQSAQMARTWNRSSTLWDRALVAYPGVPEILSNRGARLAEQRLYNEAERDLRLALARDPNLPSGLTNLALLLTLQHRYAEALPFAEQAVAAKPRSANHHDILGLTYAGLGRLHDAREQYLLALQINPDSATSHLHLARVSQQLGQLPEALDALNHTLRLAPSNQEALSLRASVHVQLHQIPRADADYREILRINPNDAASYNNLGLLRASEGAFSAARSQFLAAVRLAPNSAEFHTNLGSAYARLDRPDLAESQYRLALKLDPTHQRAQNNLKALLARPSPATAP